MCYRQILANQEAGRDGDGLGRIIRKVLLNRPCARVWAKLPVYLYYIRSRLSLELGDRVWFVHG